MSNNSNPIYVSHGTADSAEKKVKSVLEQMGGIGQWVSPGARVLIKPNFVAPFKKAVTDLDVIRSVAQMVKSAGGEPVIAESSGYEFDTEYTLRLLGVYDMAEELDIEVINLDLSPYKRISVNNGYIKHYDIAEIAITADAIINLPRLKHHSQTNITCGMKNLFGLLSRKTRAKIHTVHLDKGIVELNRIIKPVLTLVDASAVLERAVFGKEKEGMRKDLNKIIAGQDVLSIDKYCCKLIGINPDSVSHIALASEQSKGSLEYEITDPGIINSDESGTPSIAEKNRMHRLVYRTVFALEMIMKPFIGRRSVIRYFHYYLGIRPKIYKNLCNQCGDCAEICPINAIDVQRKKILPACMNLRCLRCYKECNINAIVLTGRKTLESPL